ncbi:hypothetical protein FEM48_Zijuj08G0165500 [Ziziphus jujuba var. spinosa]|uniref:Uncharacterized protein n=1 Tax=Ziziphus jujuba var. spinosa TaxID=714518 RepID=A0A978V066_ZIZJJ|nr:hypothetical protein FEM48_Zijuj08G0165500 [Ziziphus jujuba var. spinosa]
MLKQSASHWLEMTSRAWNVERNQSLGLDSRSQYKRKFDELSRYTPHLVDIDESKAQKFERGLKDGLRSPISMLWLQDAEASPSTVVDELPRISLEQELKFRINLALESRPISKIPYRMAPSEHKS